MNALQRAQRRKPKCDGCNPPAPKGVSLCGDCLDAANVLQRLERRKLAAAATTARDIIDAQPVPQDCYTPICVACGDRLDDLAMLYCYESDNGFHVKPSII